MEPLKINVSRLSSTNQTYLREIDRKLEVFIPVENIGLNQELNISNSTTVRLKRCSTKSSAVFLLSMRYRGSNQKAYITMHCSLKDAICHVHLKDCHTKGRKLQVYADKISVATKAIKCDHLELECNLNMVVDSNIVCRYISLKSNHEVRLSSSSKLKTETLKLSGKTVFIDGHVKYQRHFKNTMIKDSKENTNILSVHVNGNLHTGRDSFIQCFCLGHISRNLTGTIQLHVEGDICNHGTIEASSLMEVECGSLLSCGKCVIDTANRYFPSVKYKYGMDAHDDGLPSDMKLDDALKRYDKDDIYKMLKLGFDPYSPLENGTTLIRTATKLQWEKFCPQEKYDDDHFKAKSQVDQLVSEIEAWIKRRGSIVSPEISFKMYGDFQDLSQVKCDKIVLDIDGNICVEHESICTLGCISGKCKGDTRIHGQVKLGSFESFETTDFSIYETGTLIIQNGGNISVDNRFHNGSIVYNLNNKLSIYTGVFHQATGCHIASNEVLAIDICKDSQMIEGSIEARDLKLCMSARVTERAVIKSINSCTLEFKENKKKEYGHLNHQGCIKVDEGHIVMSPTGNEYVTSITVNKFLDSNKLKPAKSFLVIRGEGEVYNRTGGILQCTHGPVKIQNVSLLLNESRASIYGNSIEIATSVFESTTNPFSQKHNFKNNGRIISPGYVKIVACNMKNQGTIQSLHSQVEIHYTTMKHAITKLQGIILSKKELIVFVHNAAKFHCSFLGGSDSQKSSISLPKKGMLVKCTRGTVFFHTVIEGDARLVVESKKGFVTLCQITVTLLSLKVTNGYDRTNRENHTINRLHQEISNRYEAIYDHTNTENQTDPCPHSEILIQNEELCDRTEIQKYTEYRRDKHASIIILKGSLLRTEQLIVESKCDIMEIEMRTIGDGEMIIRHSFVCEPKLVINGHFTMSSSSQITAETNGNNGKICMQDKQNHFRNKRRSV